jgi:dipeptidyl aminopeptidase/acylaminoacyl peptidase
MDVDTGRLKRVAVAPESDKPVDYIIDEDGKLWYATTVDENDHRTHYRYDSESKTYHRLNFKTLQADNLNFVAPIDRKRAWVLSDHGRATQGLAVLDMAEEKLDYKAAHDAVDVMGILRSLDGRRIIGASFMPDYPIHMFWDGEDEDVRLLAALDEAFAGQMVQVTSTTTDKSRAIVFASSDRHPGQYFLWHVRQMRLEPIAATRPWIHPEEMAEMKPVTLKARDGVTLHGYLTTPRGVPARGLPLIVHPHGGPHGPRDEWGFNPEVQMLANRGFAVLQINFRGSGGYGQHFEKTLGYGHWGTTMQDDVTDATLWAIRSGIADPERVCIYGASYGGYAALMGVVREPDLYRCAVGYVGVYSLPLMYEDGDIPRTEYGRRYLEKVIGTDPKELRRRSPAFQADKIKAAVMLVQGGKDERVPPSQAEAMREALNRAGKPYEWFYSSYSAHGIVDPETNVKLYRKMLNFFRRHMGPGTKAP